ncbi:HAD family phosphatase [soil metagenome]
MLTILDFGAVLYNIDFELTKKALSALPGYNGNPINFGVDVQSDVFIDFDKGAISEAAFRAELRRLWGFTCTDAELDVAWCAILKGIFPTSADVVRNFAARGPVVLLSNISSLHLRHALPECIEMLSHFTKRFYSFEIGLRKPDPAAFHHVCATMNVAPHEATLYDDSLANCNSAAAIGMHVVRILTPEVLVPLSLGQTST